MKHISRALAAAAIATSIAGGALVASPAFAASNAPVDITSVSNGDTVTAKRPMVKGTGQPGSTVGLRSTDGSIKETITVGKNGKWALKQPDRLVGEQARIGVMQVNTDGSKSQEVVWVWTTPADL